MPVIFWTDALIALLLLIVVVFCFYVRRKEHLRAPWRQVARNRLGMTAAVVLGVYLLIGVLDSIHFHPPLETPAGEIQYSTRVLSVFDLIATPLRERVEKTYSAPFATHLYAKVGQDVFYQSLKSIRTGLVIGTLTTLVMLP